MNKILEGDGYVLFGTWAAEHLPFIISGTLKIVYDLAIFQSFRSLKPPEE